MPRAHVSRSKAHSCHALETPGATTPGIEYVQELKLVKGTAL